jgi:Ca2+-binding EF-hand superfamily protein
MKAMFRIYYSPLETKFKLVFDMYDFDGDGMISKEDIHLVLSHVPIGVSCLYSHFYYSITTIPAPQIVLPSRMVSKAISKINNRTAGKRVRLPRKVVAWMISRTELRAKSSLNCT